jgi:hypothetical protein
MSEKCSVKATILMVFLMDIITFDNITTQLKAQRRETKSHKITVQYSCDIISSTSLFYLQIPVTHSFFKVCDVLTGPLRMDRKHKNGLKSVLAF